jgi:hypothetical protein
MFTLLETGSIGIDGSHRASEKEIAEAAGNATADPQIVIRGLRRSDGSITPFEFAYLLSISPLNPKVNFVATPRQSAHFAKVLGRSFTDRFQSLMLT